MARKNGINASVRTVVCVEIKGRKSKAETGLQQRDADGLVGAFLIWSGENEIRAAVREGHGGPGSYLGFFEEKDMDRIKAWFKEHGFKNI